MHSDLHHFNCAYKRIAAAMLLHFVNSNAISFFSGGICAFASLSAGLSPGIVQLGGRVSEYCPTGWWKRKECVRIGHVVDSDAIKVALIRKESKDRGGIWAIKARWG